MQVVLVASLLLFVIPVCALPIHSSQKVGREAKATNKITGARGMCFLDSCSRILSVLT